MLWKQIDVGLTSYEIMETINFVSKQSINFSDLCFRIFFGSVDTAVGMDVSSNALSATLISWYEAIQIQKYKCTVQKTVLQKLNGDGPFFLQFHVRKNSQHLHGSRSFVIYRSVAGHICTGRAKTPRLSSSSLESRPLYCTLSYRRYYSSIRVVASVGFSHLISGASFESSSIEDSASYS